jgi:hypothetical protein
VGEIDRATGTSGADRPVSSRLAFLMKRIVLAPRLCYVWNIAGSFIGALTAERSARSRLNTGGALGLFIQFQHQQSDNPQASNCSFSPG